MTEVFTMPPAPARSFWVLGAVALLLLGLLALFASMAYRGRATRYEVTPAGLVVRAGMYGRTVPWDRLRADEARLADLADSPDLQPTLRTNGIGLPGYQAGWFRLRRAGRGLVFLTDRSRVVVVPTLDGYTLLLSADDPEGLLAALRRGSPTPPG